MAGIVFRLLGIGICAAAWWWLGARGQEEGVPGGMLLILAAHAVLIVAAILLAKPLAGFVGDWLGTLFMPGERFDKPPPMYSIPEGRLAREDYAGALEAFAELAAAHPEEIAPHLRMMEIWLRVYKDADSAQTVRDNALISIKGKKNREKFDTASRLLLGETPRA
jgi:hypothetical protein